MTLQLEGTADAGVAELAARQVAVVMEYDLTGAIDDPVLQAVVGTACTVTGFAMSAVDVHGPELQFSLAAHGSSDVRMDRSTWLCGTALAISADPVHVADLRADPRFADNPRVDGRTGTFRRYAMVPLVLDDVPVGGLSVLDRTPGELRPDQLAGLGDLARIVVERLRARRDQRLLEESRSDLREMHRALMEAQAFDQALLNALTVGVIAIEPHGQLLRSNSTFHSWHGNPDLKPGFGGPGPDGPYAYRHPDGGPPLPLDQLPLARSLSTGEAVRTELVMQPRSGPPLLLDCSSAPVLLPDGTLVGAVVSMDDITERRAMEERLRTAALHDGLTGLPNRSLLADRLAHALSAATRTGTPVAVLYCDLDGFKAVNDGFGHAAGDEVLIEAAARLTRALRPGDTVARIGGDEFVLMCPGVVCADDARTIADRVTAALDTPVATSAGAQAVGVSVGFVLSAPDSTPETLLTAADEVMYAVKRDRKGAAARR